MTRGKSTIAAITVAESLPVRTQFMMFTLIGDYVVNRGGKIWTSSLLQLMELLDVSERAVRSTLSRMTRKGWVVSKMHGRRSQYTVTPRGLALLAGGHRRIFEPLYTGWDGQWRLVVYSLPEKKRKKRHSLRKQLTWLGFGRLASGAWVSPHDRRAELEAIFAELNVEAYVDLFAGHYLGPGAAEELVQRCWDMETLAAQYTEFLDRYRPQFERDRRCFELGDLPTPEECFVRNFWLIHEYQSFPLKDPNLPITLLPEEWIGFKARRLFEQYRDLLSGPANEFVDELMKQ
jgi:phenylacetic acid degradation operon negative regulatory protein